MKKSYFPCGFRLICSGTLVVQNSSNKHCVSDAALIRGRRLFRAALIRVNTVALRYALLLLSEGADVHRLSYGMTVVFLSRNVIVRIPVDVDDIRELNEFLW